MIKELFRKDETGETKVRVKKIKITAKEIKTHIEWLDGEIRKCQKDRERYRELRKQMLELDPDDESYSALEREAEAYADADERYSKLQEQREKEFTILKKYKDSKFYVAPKDLMVIFGVGCLSFFMIALERENPKALKLASFVLKLFPIKM